MRIKYGAEQIEPVLQEFRSKHRLFLSDRIDLIEANQVSESLVNHVNSPDSYFVRPVNFSRSFIQEYLENTAHRTILNSNKSLNQDKIETHHREIVEQFEQLNSIIDSEKIRLEFHKLYQRVKRYQIYPDKFFHKEIVQKQSSGSFLYRYFKAFYDPYPPCGGLFNISTSRGEAGYSYGGDTVSDFSGGGGGSFRGGGASDSW